jgi:hypothetical protein
MIAVPALVFAILYFGFAQTVLSSPEFVAKLDPVNLEAQFRKLAPYIVANALSNPDDPESQQLLNDMFPEAGMRALATEVLPQVLASTNGDLSAEGLASALGSTLDDNVMLMIDQSPECTADVEAELLLAINGGRDLPAELCRPSDPDTKQALADALTGSMREAFTALQSGPLPGSDAGTDPSSPDTGSPSVMGQDDFKATIETVRAGAGQAFIMPAILLVLIMALAVRSVREALVWNGSILLFTGLFGLGIAFTSGSILAINWQELLTQEISSNELSIMTILLDIFDANAFTALVSWLTTVNGILSVVGAIGIAGSFFAPRPLPPAPAVLAAMPGTPNAIPTMSTSTTNPVATDLSTSALPVGDVTKPLPAEDNDSNKTDQHRL